MKFETKNSTLAEVYFKIIERTTEGLNFYLNSNKKKNFRFDIVKELKNRWKLRVDLLIDSMNGSLSKFQDSCIQKNEKYVLNSNKKNPFPSFCFPSVCSLSWGLYKYSKPNENKHSNFKLWIWNCIISGIINEGKFPVPSYLLFKNFIPLKSLTKARSLKNLVKMDKNIFISIKNLKNQNQNNTRNIDICFSKYSNTYPILAKNITESTEKDLSEDISVEELESNLNEKIERSSPPNFLLAVIEKVYRRNTKWTIVLKNGILNINKKDFLFNLCKCEFFW